MALRCKDCSAGDGDGVLNYPRSNYEAAGLLPLIEKLSRVSRMEGGGPCVAV